ncbi:MAG: hypothetical protein JXL84_05395 [Deltaproteobacteria bacterium]|nr:hypothetical protein [Deltaproteobacteria bacterium]
MAERIGISALGRNRKKAVLAVCLCLFAASLTYRIMNPYRQERVTQLTYTGRPAQPPLGPGKSPKSSGAQVQRDVLMDLYLNPPKHSETVRKNIFFRRKAAPPPSKKVLPAETKVSAPAQQPTPGMNRRLQVQEELSRFASFGYMQQEKQKILFLERGKDILVIREGDKIDGKYLVKSITEKVLVIKTDDLDEEIRIELGQF